MPSPGGDVPRSVVAALAAVREQFDGVAYAGDADLIPYAVAVEPADRAISRICESPAPRARAAAAALRNPDGLDAAARRETRVTVLAEILDNPRTPDAARAEIVRRRVDRGVVDEVTEKAIVTLSDADELAAFADSDLEEVRRVAVEQLRSLAVAGGDASVWRAAVAAGVSPASVPLSARTAAELTDDELWSFGDGDKDTPYRTRIVAVAELASRAADDDALRRLVTQRPKAAVRHWLRDSQSRLRVRHVADLDISTAEYRDVVWMWAERVASATDATERELALEHLDDVAAHPQLTGLVVDALKHAVWREERAGEAREWLTHRACATLRAALLSANVLRSVDEVRVAARDLVWDDVVAPGDAPSPGATAALCDHADAGTRQRALEAAAGHKWIGTIERVRPGTAAEAVRAGAAELLAGNAEAVSSCDEETLRMVVDVLAAERAWPALGSLATAARNNSRTTVVAAVAGHVAERVGRVDDPYGQLERVFVDVAEFAEADEAVRAGAALSEGAVDQLVNRLLRDNAGVDARLWAAVADRVPVRRVHHVAVVPEPPNRAAEGMLRALGDTVVARLGDDADAYAQLDALASSWHGSWGDLLDATAAICRPPQRT